MGELLSVGNINHWFFDFDYGQSLYKDNFITYVTAIKINLIKIFNLLKILKFSCTAKLPRGSDLGVFFGLYMKGHALTRRRPFE